MGNRKKRIAFIPVRGGSKSIPKKNIKKIAGKPLVYWVIDAALNSNVFDDVYISTDDPEISEIVYNHSNSDCLTLVKRSPETATDTATTESAMLEFASNHDFEYITLLQATSPLVEGDDIKGAMELFCSNGGADSVLSVCRQERFIWRSSKNGYCKPENYDPDNRPRRQDFEGFLVENGALYITDKDSLLETGCRLSGNMLCYEMPPETYFELDEPSDWNIIEGLLEARKDTSCQDKIKKIKLFLTDVDGVLTDAGMYYSEKGDELKKFNTRDGKGLELLRNNGIEVGIVTSEDTQIVSDRAKKLKINIVHQGAKDKNKILNTILNDHNLSHEEIAYIGDDINDLPFLEQVGFSACPADAMETIKKEVNYACRLKGGEGCVREVADLILRTLSR